MNPATNARTHKILSFDTRWIWDAFGVIGIFTVQDYASKRWPDGTTIVEIVLAVTVGTGLLWIFVVAPFLEGLREGKKPEQA